MARCLISLGANIGDPLTAIRSASNQLRQRLVGEDGAYRLSRLFRTPPVGGPAGQPPFVNAVAALDTQFSVLQVWQAIREVEQELGRERDRRWEARRIDLDILLYDEVRIWTPQLKIPHPRMCMRRFILIPALDVAPTWTDPVSGWSIEELAASLQSGPGSLLLVSDDVAALTDWLPEIARQTMADILPLGTTPPTSTNRWVGLASLADAWSQSQSLPKLSMVLTSSNQPSSDIEVQVDWETRNLELAENLHMVSARSYQSASPAPHLPIVGPRYLLSSDDRAWAIHEIVSALEAMDCPVEPLGS